MEQYAGYEERSDRELIVTDVQTQVKRAERRSIFINGEFAFGVSEDTYVRYALYKGRVVTAELLEEIRREDELVQCKQTAMRFLERRMRSRQEVERKLAGKEYSPEAIEATLRFLTEYRLVDDREFARVFVSDQLLRRPLGKRRLGDELRRKGLDKEEIAETLGSAIGAEDELANAMAAAEKKARTIRHDDPRKWERSMASFLAGRGFGWDVVGKVLTRFREERKHQQSENDTATEDMIDE